jgi:peptidoglycan/LPS O-acetylase OafA/YrhL
VKLTCRTNIFLGTFLHDRISHAGALCPGIEMNKSFADYQAATFRPGFDGLRGVGFLLVVTAHIPAVPLFSYLQGWTAVWVFFAISGYLVAMLLIREERKPVQSPFASS